MNITRKLHLGCGTHVLPGDRLLRECWRVLAPGGRIRVGVPDLGMFLRLFDDPSTWTDDMRAYAGICAAWHGNRTPCQILNWLVRQGEADGSPFAHKFQYDGAELHAALVAAGFVEVARHAVGESDDPELRGVENVERLPPRMLAVETMVLEARKP